jgi:hypothetical protein
MNAILSELSLSYFARAKPNSIAISIYNSLDFIGTRGRLTHFAIGP